MMFINRYKAKNNFKKFNIYLNKLNPSPAVNAETNTRLLSLTLNPRNATGVSQIFCPRKPVKCMTKQQITVPSLTPWNIGK